MKEKIKNCFICGDSSHCARDCEKRFKPKESNDHIHNKINVNTLKIESEKQNSDECTNLQYVNNQIDDWLRQGIIKESVFDYCSDIVLCKKANGAMKTSSVEFISRSPTPSPMERKYRRFVLLRRIFQPWQWKRRKREIVSNRRQNSTEENIDAFNQRSTC
ncbi:hypothetical protein TNCV_1346411 [Trichonephila clavipes]|nr:hypothetical protein TNCV_1346411 [Trichonephila clavipes]